MNSFFGLFATQHILCISSRTRSSVGATGNGFTALFRVKTFQLEVALSSPLHMLLSRSGTLSSSNNHHLLVIVVTVCVPASSVSFALSFM